MFITLVERKYTCDVNEQHKRLNYPRSLPSFNCFPTSCVSPRLTLASSLSSSPPQRLWYTQEDNEHNRFSKSASLVTGLFGVGRDGKSITVCSRSCVIDCKNAVGLATREKEAIDASRRGGTLGPAEIDVNGDDNTLWSSIS